MFHPHYTYNYFPANDKPSASVEDEQNDPKPEGESVDTEKLLENIAEQTKSTRNLYLVYISYLLYFTLSIFSIQDIELLLDSTVTLPFFQVPVATDAFFYLAPVLAIVLFVYFQLHLTKLRELINALRVLAREKVVHISPWLVTDVGVPGKSQVSKLQQAIVRIALWWLLPLTLALCTYWILTKHDTWDSFIVTNIFMIGVGFNLYFRYKASPTRRMTWLSNKVQKLRRMQKHLLGIVMFYLWIYVLFGAVIPSINSGAIFLKLYNADISAKPAIAESTRSWAVLNGVNLNGADLRYAYFHRASLVRAELRNVKAAYSDFSGADLSFAHLDGAYLSEARLDGADLRSAHLDGAYLSEACLDSADLSYASLDGAYLGFASLDRADLHAARFNGASLHAAHLNGAALSRASLDRADLSFAKLHGAKLRSAHLDGASIFSAHLDGADLRAARLDSVELRLAKLHGADLRNAKLHGADLCDADLSNANLRNANLRNANLSFATLDGVRFWGTHLKDARCLTVEQLLSVRSLYEAELPDSLLAVFESGSELTVAQRRRYQYLRSEESLYE